ncbi:GNAT family N-acetyltransferase [Pseudomonas sp. NPDC007930]|uniref:GNAT family N-acetyltransferase n=1 Tax=Pseudomonas sp. NPDC007930 TaxID=3364417 RepID=UPI0036E77303
MNAAQLRRVTVDSFAHYRTGLVELLLDAVRQGATLGFMADLDAQQANAYYSEIKARLAIGDTLIWVVVKHEQVIASVQLALCQRANGTNRAEVQKLLVYEHAQRHGLGAQLMTAAEQAARQMGRGLLHLDTEAGSPAEAFYRAQGYVRAGEIPGFACRPDGDYRTTAFYYKTL